MSLKDETAARVRRFLAVSDDMRDDEPMWMAGGIPLTWGDLRVLADYDRADRVEVQLNKHEHHCLECNAIVTSTTVDSMANLPCGHAAGTLVVRRPVET
jgi:hypothetical protein